MFATVLVISLLIIYAFKGFKEGAIVEFVNLVGACLVLAGAFIFKSSVSEILYTYLPFLNFNGLFKGLTILNIILYELIAFCFLAGIFMLIYSVILRATKIFDKLVKATIVLALPLKIVGILIGFVEGVIVTFAILFVLNQISYTREYIEQSNAAQNILENTPLLSDASKPFSESVNEIYNIAEQYKDNNNKNEANLKSLNILLKYRILNPDTAKKLQVSGKLKIDGADKVIEGYLGE